MGVEILSDPSRAVLFCNTSDVAFGPVFSSESEAADFLAWLPRDGQTAARQLGLLPALGHDGTDPRDWATDHLTMLRLAYLREEDARAA